MIQKNEPLSSKDFSKGLVTRSDIINNDPNKSPNCMDIKWFFDGAIGKRLGASTTNSVTIGSSATASWTIDSNGTLTTNLQDYWKLDETGGGRVDAQGVIPLYDVNSTGSIVGIRNLAALFVASKSNALVGSSTGSVLTGNVNFSMSSWIYLNSTNGSIEQTIISKRDPDKDNFTVLLLHMDGTPFVDSSPSAHTMSTSGAVLLGTSETAAFNNAGQFNGANTQITTPGTADFTMGTGDFTQEFLVNLSNTSSIQFMTSVSGNAFDVAYFNTIPGIRVFLNAANYDFSWSPVANTWYHILVSRNASNLRVFVNGSQIGTTQTSTDNVSTSTTFFLGVQFNGAQWLSGFLDEVRVRKGIATQTSNFVSPIAPYSTTAQAYEYWLYVNTNNNATFRVSSNNSSQTATIQASSFGALNTSTWYNVIGWHSNNSHIGISVNLSVNTAAYSGGVKAGSANFVLGAISDSTLNPMTSYIDSRIDEVGFWNKVLSSQERLDLYGGGSGNTFTGAASAFGWAMFDFGAGASGTRWVTVAQGSGLVASSNLGTTFVTIATSRTQTYQYLDRSKNVLIATSDAYDPPLYWAGSASTFAITLGPTSAPAVKYSINYNGFLILLNSSTRKRGFFYNDENTQLSDIWSTSFDFPSSADDEITACFVLYKFLYVSTRYRIFRVAFVGGNPDWSFLKIKDWGFVPRTAKLATVKGSQVVIGMDWQRRMRVFDGFEDFFISDSVENDNKYCDFALNKVSYAGSGLVVSHAEVDLIEQEYRLNLAIGAQSSQTTHAIVLNLRTLAMYPYSNQQYQAMCIAESNNQQHLMAVDRSGFIHILNSGNMDISQPISEIFDSSLIYKSSPTQVSRSQQLNVYFSLGSYGTIYQQERMDFSNVFSTLKPLSDKDGNMEIKGTEPFLQVLRTLDVPATYNTYQFRLTSSSGTASPWKLTRFEFLQEPRGFGMGG